MTDESQPDTRRIFLDTSALAYYRHSPGNYTHFLVGNLLEVFITLTRLGFPERGFRLAVPNPTDRFLDFYRLLGASSVERRAEADEGETVISVPMTFRWDVEHGDARDEVVRHFAAFSDYICEQTAAASPEPRTLSLVSRGHSLGKRYLVNEAEVAAALERVAEAHGLAFQRIDFAGMTLEEQIAAMRETRLLFGLHGAGIMNALFLQSGSALVEVFTHPRVYNTKYALMCARRGVAYLDFKTPAWAFPTLYNLLICIVRRGHLGSSKYFKDRNPILAPADAVALAEAALGGETRPELPPLDGWQRLGLLRQHRVFVRAAGIGAVVVAVAASMLTPAAGAVVAALTVLGVALAACA